LDLSQVDPNEALIANASKQLVTVDSGTSGFVLTSRGPSLNPTFQELDIVVDIGTANAIGGAMTDGTDASLGIRAIATNMNVGSTNIIGSKMTDGGDTTFGLRSIANGMNTGSVNLIATKITDGADTTFGLRALATNMNAGSADLLINKGTVASANPLGAKMTDGADTTFGVRAIATAMNSGSATLIGTKMTDGTDTTFGIRAIATTMNAGSANLIGTKLTDGADTTFGIRALTTNMNTGSADLIAGKFTVFGANSINDALALAGLPPCAVTHSALVGLQAATGTATSANTLALTTLNTVTIPAMNLATGANTIEITALNSTVRSATSPALVFAGPVSGPIANPSFRSLANTDLPNDLSRQSLTLTRTGAAALTVNTTMSVAPIAQFTNTGGGDVKIQCTNPQGDSARFGVYSNFGSFASSAYIETDFATIQLKPANTTRMIVGSSGTQVNTALNLNYGTAFQMVGLDTSKNVVPISNGSTNFILTSNGPGALPSFQAATATTVVANLANGVAGNIPYQVGPNDTEFIATGTGVLLGGTTPSYSMNPTLSGLSLTGTTGPLFNIQVTSGFPAAQIVNTTAGDTKMNFIAPSLQSARFGVYSNSTGYDNDAFIETDVGSDIQLRPSGNLQFKVEPTKTSILNTLNLTSLAGSTTRYGFITAAGNVIAGGSTVPTTTVFLTGTNAIYTPPAFCTRIQVLCIGAGGGGGGVIFNAPGVGAGGGGGGIGGCNAAAGTLDNTGAYVPYTFRYTVGVGGVGALGLSGTAGGNTDFYSTTFANAAAALTVAKLARGFGGGGGARAIDGSITLRGVGGNFQYWTGTPTI
jgi:hypothetical protein